VLSATIDLLAERGMEATTIQAVSDRSGIARATIYLRWPGRSALVLAALRWAIGRPPFELSGDIATDFQRGVCTDLLPVTITTPTTGTTPTVGTTAETVPAEATSFHLHIAATMDAETGKLVATYVRLQGPKIGEGDELDDN